MNPLNWNRIFPALLVAALSAIVTFNSVGMVMNPCETAWSQCFASRFPWPLIGLELAIATLVALLALPLYMLMHSARLQSWRHLAFVGTSVSVLVGFCVGFIKFGSNLDVGTLLVFCAMGAVAGSAFWLLVRVNP